MAVNEASNTIRNPAPLAPIRLGTRDGDVRHARAQLFLLIFLRAVAMLWIVEGLVHWGDLLAGDAGTQLTNLSTQRMMAVFFFCVLDFVAAVGLWIATPWGGVVWFVTVGAQLLACVTLPGFWSHGALLVSSDAALVCAYVVLAWRAGHGERDA